jgi:NADPH:quinone reductase-like Zn-dependent oxidoreductase
LFVLSETLMIEYGLLVTSWPIVLGCDATAQVVELGEGVSQFKVGDYVFGCTRLGVKGYCTFQEYVSKILSFKFEIC